MLKRAGPAFLIAATLASSPALACADPYVAFPFASARMKPEGRAEVADVAATARPGGIVKLTALTDGSAPNRKMAHRRAQAVKAALVSDGVLPRQIRIEFLTVKGRADETAAREVWMSVTHVPTCG